MPRNVAIREEKVAAVEMEERRRMYRLPAVLIFGDFPLASSVVGKHGSTSETGALAAKRKDESDLSLNQQVTGYFAANAWRNIVASYGAAVGDLFNEVVDTGTTAILDKHLSLFDCNSYSFDEHECRE